MRVARVPHAARARRSPAAPTTPGTTRRDERRDALAAAARLIVAADELAGDDPDFLVTAARILVEPNAFTTVPSGVRLWIDGRTPDAEALDGWRAALGARGAASWPRRTGVAIELATASRSEGVAFDPGVLRRAGRAARARLLRRPRRRHPRPAACPPGWCFVRNATGVSHAPEEHVELDDAAVAAQPPCDALERLA